MKLHLPKALFTAVLAACVVPAAIAETVTVTTETSVNSLSTGYTGIIVNDGGVLDFGSGAGTILADGITINNGGVAKYSGNNEQSFAPSTAVTINGGGELQLLGTSDGLAWGSGPTSVTLTGSDQDTIATVNTKGRITFATTINMNGYALIGQTQDAVNSGSDRACLDTWSNNKLVVSNQGNVIDLEIMLRKDFNITTTSESSLTINGSITRHASEELSNQSVNIEGDGNVTFNGDYASRELHIGGLTENVTHTTTVQLSGANSNIESMEVKAGATLTLDAGSTMAVKGTFTNNGTFNMNGVISVGKALGDFTHTLTDEAGSTNSGNGWLTSATLEGIVTGNGTINVGTTAGVKLTISEASDSIIATNVSNNNGVFSATFASSGAYIIGEGNTVILSESITNNSSSFTVLQGGTLNINGMMDGAIKDKDVILHANSALINTGANHTTDNASFDSIVLKGNASVGQATGTSNDISLLAGSYNATTLNLNGNTLTKKGGGVFYITNSTISSGIIDIQSGSVNLRGASTINGTVFNVSEGATLRFTEQTDAGGKSPAERGEIILNATGTGLIKADSDVNIVGTKWDAAAAASAFAGTIEMTGGTLRLGNPQDHWESHSATLDSATIKLSNGAAFRFAGDGLSVGSIHVAGNGTNVIESHETKTDAAGKGFSTGKLRLDSNVRMYSTWATTIDIGELVGTGELRVWHKRNDTSLNLNIDSIHDYTGDIILGKDQDGTLINPTRINAYIGAAGTTSSISGTISNYGTLNIGTAAAEGVTASTISLLSTIENGGTLSLSGNITLGMDMSKYTLAQPAEGGSYSYNEHNGFYTANGSSYYLVYLVEGNIDNITLSTQQATLGESTVTLEKTLDGVVFENSNSSTSTEFFITNGELTRSSLIQETETTHVTDSTAFQVKGNGVLVLSNESANADLITVEGEGKVKVTETATLTNANALANSVIGNGTIELSYDTSYNSVPNAGADFSGTTHIKEGYFTINGASFGNKLILDDGVNFQLSAGSTVTLAADKQLVLNGTSEVHQNTNQSTGKGADFTVNGVVSGNGTYDRRGGGTLTFNNSVTLEAFSQTICTGTSVFNGNLSLTGNLTAKQGTIEIGVGTHSVNELDVSNANASTATVRLKSGAQLTSRSKLWLHTGDAKILLEDTASLTRDQLKVSGTSHTDGTSITRVTGEDGGDEYSLGNTSYVMKNAKVEVATAEGGATISNRLINVALTNTGTGTLVASNGYNTYTALVAKAGNLDIRNFGTDAGENGQGDLELLEIAAGKTIGVHTPYNSSINATSDKATIAVSGGGAATFGTGANLHANLTLNNGAVLTLGEGGLNMNKSVLSLGSSLTLDLDTLLRIMELAEDKVALFTDVSELILGGQSYTAGSLTEDNRVALSEVFSLENMPTALTAAANTSYYLGFDGNGMVYAAQIVPEPTTATLSLLALAALAARRRRK